MKVWLIKAAENALVQKNVRLGRVGILGKYLAEHGHDVTCWASTYKHGEKEYIFRENKKIHIANHLDLVMLHSPIAYKKNTSIKRAIYAKIISRQFRKLSEMEEKPDIICASWPLMSLAEEAVLYGKRHSVPVVVDARDMWPDIFTRTLPKPLVRCSSFLLWPLQRVAYRTFSQADAITGVTPTSLQWALNKAKRSKNDWDQYIFIGYDDTFTMTEDERLAQLKWWADRGVTEATFNVTFFGSMSRAIVDTVTAIEGIKQLVSKHPDIRLILCGDGDAQARNKELAKDIPQVVLPGWCDNAQIQSVLSISNVGLYCLRNLFDFRDTISNKFIGYAAAGLPILSELQGFSKQYMEKYNMGLTYQEDNPSSFTKAVEWLYMHPDQAEEMGRNAHKRFETDFSSEVVNRNFLTLFKQIVADFH